FPAKYIFSHYGIAWPQRTPAGSGTPSNPIYHYPGSGNDLQGPITTSLAAVQRPAETAIVSDAFTGYARDGQIWIGFGCEAAGFHHDGGNFIFLDGHSHKIVRNAERYEKQGSDGKWFEQY